MTTLQSPRIYKRCSNSSYTLVGLSWLLVVCASWLNAQTADLLTPRDVAKIQYVSSAKISPDGNWIAFTKVVPRDPFKGTDGPAHVELHVTDPTGNVRPYVTGKVSISQIQWTPDGSSIAYVARRGEDKNASLYVLPLAGGESRKLIEFDASMHHVKFAADGKRFVFLATPPRSKTETEWRDKGFNQEIYEEDWRPTRVWLAAVDGHSKPKALDLTGSAYDVVWSPDGKRLAVVLAPRALVDDSYMFKRIQIVDADTGKVLERIENAGKLGAIEWSPDGKQLAMISAVDIHDPAEGRLMVVSIPGDEKPHDLMPDYQAHVEAFAWKSADEITFVGAEGTETSLGSVTMAGKITTRVSKGEVILQSLSLSEQGAIAVVANTPAHPSEAFLIDDKSAVRRLTDSNPWLKQKQLGQQEVIRWTASDGLELEGILIKPLNYEAGRRYPLIMTVHGGPEAHISNGWVTRYSYAGQVGAARGFAVFYPNYRGSTGRGVAFSKMGQADAAGKEFQDLVEAIDHLVDTGLVDRDRVGITGGSYGGFASAWGATYYSEQFAASVMFVGISDNVSKVGTTDIPEEMFLVHHLKRLWDDWEYFIERSPIRHIQKNRTPTLILHGKDDPRVHPSQSLELYRHLKTLNQAPVRLVFYPGEGHGNRRAASRLDYQLRMLRWMEIYLQSPEGRAAKKPDFAIDYSKE